MIQIKSWDLFKALLKRAQIAEIPFTIFGTERSIMKMHVLGNEVDKDPIYNSFALCCQMYTVLFTRSDAMTEAERVETLSPDFEYIAVDSIAANDGILTIK